MTVGLAALIVLLGCAKQPSPVKEDPELRGLILGPVLADSSLKFLAPDSAAVGIGEYDSAHKTYGRDHFWLVDYVWFFLPQRPLKFRTFAEMHKLEQKGKIDSTTVVGMITYRYGLEAVDIEHLRKRAVELRPKVPPPALSQAVDQYVAMHRATLEKFGDTTASDTSATP